MKKEGWLRLLEFTKALINPLKIGRRGVQVSVISFGNRATIAFYLNEYTNKQDIFAAIDEIPWKDQETNTSGGIRTMHEQIFIPERGDRRGVPNIGIVLTDGESTRDQPLTIPEANKAKAKGKLSS